MTLTFVQRSFKVTSTIAASIAQKLLDLKTSNLHAALYGVYPAGTSIIFRESGRGPMQYSGRCRAPNLCTIFPLEKAALLTRKMRNACATPTCQRYSCRSSCMDFRDLMYIIRYVASIKPEQIIKVITIISQTNN